MIEETGAAFTGFARTSYGTLCEQAVAALEAAPHGLDDAALAGALFGTGLGGRWATLLSAVLGGDQRIERVDDHWRLVRRPSVETWHAAAAVDQATDHAASTNVGPTQAPATVTLALATTGADPRRHRIVRVALVRFEDGAVTARFDAVVSAGRRLPGYLAAAAQVAADDLELAPTFVEIMPQLLELVNGDAVHVYGASRTRAFIDAELRRADMPTGDLELVEIDGLLRSQMADLKKPGLFAAADELGIQHLGKSTPLAEAEVAARVLDRLRQRLSASPARDTMDVLALTSAAQLPFTSAWLADIPEAPGVYLFLGAAGETLYVGKAANLRRRLADYVRRHPSLHRRFEALGVRTATVETILMASDLEVTLLEARLIRERQPVFNTVRAVQGPATIVRVAPDGRSSGVRLVERAAADGARYFGPFESVSAARAALAVARAAYPEAFGREREDANARKIAVLDVACLLAGQREPTIAALRRRMREEAAAGRPPDVDRVRSALAAVQALSPRMSDLAGRSDGWRLLVLERINEWGGGRLHLIRDGQLLGSADTDTSTLPVEPAAISAFADAMFGGDTSAEQVAGAAAWTPEDSTIVLRWIAQSRARIEIQRLLPVLPDLP